MNNILVNLKKKFDRSWSIDGGFDIPEPWNFTYMLGGILRHRCFLDIEIDDVDRLDIDVDEELHRSLIDMRDNDPGWCISGTWR